MDKPRRYRIIKKIIELEDSHPSDEKLLLARTLFARALETPGGLKIQTIHAFCEALLHQFPLEAQISGRFSVIDDRQQEDLLNRARQEVFLTIESASQKELTIAYEQMVNFAGELAVEEIVTELIYRREEIGPWLESVGGVAASHKLARKSLGFTPDETVEEIHTSILNSLQIPPKTGNNYPNSLGKTKAQTRKN